MACGLHWNVLVDWLLLPRFYFYNGTCHLKCRREGTSADSILGWTFHHSSQLGSSYVLKLVCESKAQLLHLLASMVWCSTGWHNSLPQNWVSHCTSKNWAFMSFTLNIMFTHTLFTPRMSVNTARGRPNSNPFGLFNKLTNPLFKKTPFNGGVAVKQDCQPFLIGTYCWSMAWTMVDSVTRNKRWELAARISHSKCICQCTA